MGSDLDRQPEIDTPTLDDALAATPVCHEVVEDIDSIRFAFAEVEERKREGLASDPKAIRKFKDRLYHLWGDCDEVPAIPVETPYEEMRRSIKFVPIDSQGMFMVLIQTEYDDDTPETHELLSLWEALVLSSEESIGNEIELIEKFRQRMPEALRGYKTRKPKEEEACHRIVVPREHFDRSLEELVKIEMLEEFEALIRKGNDRTRFESSWFYAYLEMYGEEMMDIAKIRAAISENVRLHPGSFLAADKCDDYSDDDPGVVLPEQEMPESNEGLRALCVRAEFFSIDSMDLSLEQRLERIRLQQKLSHELELLTEKENDRTRGESDWFYYLQTVIAELEVEVEEDLLIDLWNESEDVRTITIEGHYSIKELPDGLLLFRDGNACELLNLNAAAKKLQADNVIEAIESEIDRMRIESERLKAEKRGMRRYAERIDELGRSGLRLQGQRTLIEGIVSRASVAS
ncbi:hypothetical protein ACFL3C_01645 [Patescibacteria group bacterium]